MPAIDTVHPLDYQEVVTLEDGAQVNLRAIRPDDAPRLQEGFKRLSKESIYMRFLETIYTLTDDQAGNLATVDYHKRMALVGAVQEDGEERLVAVARYAMIEGDEDGLAEVAVIVRDDYQGRGLGTISMQRLLEYGNSHGIHTIVATVNVNNRRTVSFIEHTGLPFERRVLEPGTWEIRIHLQ